MAQHELPRSIPERVRLREHRLPVQVMLDVARQCMRRWVTLGRRFFSALGRRIKIATQRPSQRLDVVRIASEREASWLGLMGSCQNASSGVALAPADTGVRRSNLVRMTPGDTRPRRSWALRPRLVQELRSRASAPGRRGWGSSVSRLTKSVSWRAESRQLDCPLALLRCSRA
jgi:hypothetical protein